jgi:hypothetical protein
MRATQDDLRIRPNPPQHLDHFDGLRELRRRCREPEDFRLGRGSMVGHRFEVVLDTGAVERLDDYSLRFEARPDLKDAQCNEDPLVGKELRRRGIQRYPLGHERLQTLGLDKRSAIHDYFSSCQG